MPSASQYLSYLSNPRVKAWLDTIAWAEGGKTYFTLYGGGSFSGNQHPNRKITAGAYTSTAAGRYQFLYSTWIGIKNKLGLSDFSPTNQDIAALELTYQRGALTDVINGNLEAALKTLGCAWAALPFSTCGQRMQSWQATQSYYNNAVKVYGGGIVNTVINSPIISDISQLNFLPTEITEGNNNTTLYIALGILGIVILTR